MNPPYVPFEVPESFENRGNIPTSSIAKNTIEIEQDVRTGSNTMCSILDHAIPHHMRHARRANLGVW